MGIFDGILICTDLDGTLYKNDKTISKENKDAIDFFKSEGGAFTFITGRLPYYSLDAFRAVQPNVPYGCINGGGLYDGTKGLYIWTTELPHDALDLVQCIDETLPEVGIQLCCFDKTYFAKENSTTVHFRHVTGLPDITCDYHGFLEPIGKVIFCADAEDQISAIERTLLSHDRADDFSFIRSERTLFELLPKGVNKGLALKKLAEYLRIEMKKTIAIGDYDNDISMLRAAGIGIAVNNASIGAKQAADHVTVSNEEHAIAKVIYDIEHKRYKL